MLITRPRIRREVEVYQEIWKALQFAWVVVLFVTRIRISSVTNRLNPDILIVFIRAYAVLSQMQQRREVVDGMPVIFVDRSDFDAVASVFHLLNGGRRWPVYEADRTVVCDSEGATSHRRTRAYT